MQVLKNKKQLILGILLDIFICFFTFIIFFFSLSNKTTEVSSSFNNSESNVLTVNIDNTSTGNEEVPEIVTDEKASDKELKEEKVTKKEQKKSTSPYYIKVNYKANVVTIYTKDKDNKYTVPYKAMVCSSGKYTPTSGTYKTSSKYRWGKLIHDVYGQYATRIVGSILFHSVPYSDNKNDKLLYTEYDKLGTKASEGCVRLTVKDAKWIYDNCPSGTMVEFYSSSEPGPLGKPTAQKISSVVECRDWDPTDPASENPWHTYKREEEKPSEDLSNNITNDVINNTVIENTNNSVIDNNIVDNSNNIITNTKSTVNNNTVDNNIDNNTVNNSTISNNITDNSSSSNNTTDSSNNLNNTNIGDNSSVENNVTNTPSSSDNTDTNNNPNGSVNDDSTQNNTNANNLLINNIV